ncbi:DUF3089 domain-containing protein [Aurantivibrio plasticivorans]
MLSTKLSRSMSASLLLSSLAFGVSVSAETLPADYSKPESWLCRGADKDLGACDVDMTTTIVNADGSMGVEKFSKTDDAKVDCFYVYPTVSLDKTGNSDMVAGPEEYSVVKQQFARYGSVCRTFAPLYRQVTLTALRAGISRTGGAAGVDRTMNYGDVVAAWNNYLENYNDGRGVILVGHSQGSGVLTQLIKKEIEGKPIQKQIISAMLIGTRVQVPAGKTVGATFEHMPLCESATQNECIVTYASFRSDVPPPEQGMFGKNGKDSVSACTSPAKLADNTTALHAYLNTQQGVSSSSVSPLSWTKDTPQLETPFASVPGLLTGKCVANERGGYFEMTVHGDPKDPRTDDISGDVMNADGSVNASWGLHLVDMNITMGNLISLARQQSEAYLAK